MLRAQRPAWLGGRRISPGPLTGSSFVWGRRREGEGPEPPICLATAQKLPCPTQHLGLGYPPLWAPHACGNGGWKDPGVGWMQAGRKSGRQQLRGGGAEDTRSAHGAQPLSCTALELRIRTRWDARQRWCWSRSGVCKSALLAVPASVGGALSPGHHGTLGPSDSQPGPTTGSKRPRVSPSILGSVVPHPPASCCSTPHPRLARVRPRSQPAGGGWSQRQTLGS